MGSPEFSLASLRSLNSRYAVVGVVTQPDRPAGRGQTLTPPPVKVLAGELGIPLIQPRRLREPEAQAQLQAWAPDLIVVAAFGQILRQNVLDLPRYGCINVHGSYLPRWRGAAPIQAAILSGDEFTGVTIMRMDAGVDTGAMLARRAEPIREDDTAESLSKRLAPLGAELLMETLPAYLDGNLQPEPQDETLATYAPMLKKEDGLLDFSQPADVLARKVRAYQPWPGAFTTWQDQMLKVGRAHAVEGREGQPGATRLFGGFPAVTCGEGTLVLEQLQPAGKRPMEGKVFLSGARGWGSAWLGK
jgi:methionyl-tRNA formyltransferase